MQQLYDTLSQNPFVKVQSNNHIKIAKLKALQKAPTLRHLRAEVEWRWPTTNLLDVLTIVPISVRCSSPTLPMSA